MRTRGQALRDGRRGAITGSVWKWVNEDVGDKYQYAKSETLQPLIGYWVYAQAAATVTVEGTPVQDTMKTLMKGWNLVGPTCRMSVPPAAEYNLRVRCWQWDADSQKYTAVETLRPCFGYWLNAGEDDVAIPLEAGSGADDGPGEQER